LGGAVQLLPKLGRRPQQCLRQETAIDERLTAVGEVEEVRRLGIGRRTDCRASQCRVSLLQVALGAGFERSLEPWRDAGQQPGDSLQVRVLPPGKLVLAGGLHRHVPLQSAASQVFKHRLGQSGKQAGPVYAVTRRGWLRKALRQPCGAQTGDCLKRCAAVGHRVGGSISHYVTARLLGKSLHATQDRRANGSRVRYREPGMCCADPILGLRWADSVLSKRTAPSPRGSEGTALFSAKTITSASRPP